MKIIGQYNKAFIIARRHVEAGEGEGKSDDLFIIGKRGESSRLLSPAHDISIADQHAADEKYNFETLQAITKIQSQRLIQYVLVTLSNPTLLTTCRPIEQAEKARSDCRR